jgi:predicted histidine transporter YuiF (NhaC family)
LLIGLGITAGIGTGIGGIALSVSFYNQLSADLTNNLEQVVRPIVTMQDQWSSINGPPKLRRVGLTHC